MRQEEFMLKLSTLLLVLLFSSHSKGSDGGPCKEVSLCTAERVKALSGKASKLGREIKRKFDLKLKLTEEEKEILNSELAQWATIHNEIQTCESTLNRPRRDRVPPCSLTIRSEEKLSSNLKIVEVSHRMRSINGKCQKAKVIQEKSIQNSSGKILAYGFKERWKLKKQIECKTQNGEITTRSIQFGGLSQKYNRDGYIFIMDLSEDDSYLNSTFRAKRINLKKMSKVIF